MPKLPRQIPTYAAPTWIDLLQRRADQTGADSAYTFLLSGEDQSTGLTYAELDRRARIVAAALAEHCAPGDRALLLYPSGLDFLTAFYGCLYAGVIAVPAYPPRANESIHRLKAIVIDAEAHVALTTRALLTTSRQVTPENLGDARLRLLTTDDLPDSLAVAWQRPAVQPDSLAFLQYTSGSTGQPKGVMLTHANLLANSEMIRRVTGGHRESVVGGWLPLFHDMGLIGLALQSVYCGGHAVLMPPAAFLQKPLRWLQMVSRYRINRTGGPNFGFELCARRITAEERATLDLSSWETAFNGSEPIHAATLARFAETFADCGFRARSFLPCYGMAEASLMVTGKPSGTAVVAEHVDPVQLAGHVAVPVSAPAVGRELISSGRVAPGVIVAIVDPQTRTALPDGTVGEIWAAGANIGVGYWQRPELSEATFGAKLAGRSRRRFLRTGDLGYVRGGELFVTGRIKDVIIVRGRNHYPQDLEATASVAHPALRPHSGAAFAIEDDAAEALVVVQEVERTALRSLDVPAVVQAIRESLLREHELNPHAIVLVKPATVPKTSSGKIQRSECRRQFLAGELSQVGEWRRGQAEPGAGLAPEAPAAAPAPAAVVFPRSKEALQEWITVRVAAALQVSPGTINPRTPFQQLGLDSMAGVALSGELETHLGRPVPATVVYDFPTIEQLAAHYAGADSVAPVATSRGDAEAGAIAIIGLGCRFPGGATTPAAFWELLRQGTDAIGEIPADRWDVAAHFDSNPETPGKMYVRHGGFIGPVDGFDPEFFGIAQREALAMDPQHRLLLEVAWEALEDAGIAPTSLAGSETGVYVGVSFDDYAALAARSGSSERIDAYSSLGSARALAAARISYHLGLRGPSLVTDTLCSSSLLAVHLAVQALRAGECRLALAGGANLMLTPEATIASCKLRALAPDGRCKTFDAAANGYARGEGVGVVVLKRLRDAERDGDPIVAVIRGSAVNHDGHSNGLTAPSGTAQEILIRRALQDASAAAGDVGYVEAHGTGTILGDPIEVQALGAVYGGQRPPDRPLLLGTVKTNVGHLEAAAGICGLIKVALAVRHRELPATLHFRTPNPHIPWDRLRVRVVDRPMPWPADHGPLAGVSSFGLGGTNVHVVVAPAPGAPTRAAPAAERTRHLFTLSGHTPAAAAQAATAWAAALARHPAASFGDFCFSANTGRSHFAYRRALVVASPGDLAAQLAALTPEDFTRAGAAPGRIAFLFPGQGSQYPGMARELYETQREFRATIDACAEAFAGLLPQPLTDVLFASDATLLNQTLYAQPAIFAVELALGRLWLAWGLQPTAVFGHSVGEYAAACLAGVFSLADAARLLATKARLTHGLPADGAMFAAAAAPERLAPHLITHPQIEVAAYNGPSATTLSGPTAVMSRLVEIIVRAGIGAQPLPIAQAFHSRALDPILAEFTAVAETITYHAPAFPVVTSLQGTVAGSEIGTAAYWRRQMREPVQFARGVATLGRELGCTTFIEVGPKPSLTSLGQAIYSRAEREHQLWLPSLRPNRADWSVLLTSLAELYLRGVQIDWQAFDRAYARHRLGGLPTTPFQRHRCWLPDPPRLAPVLAAPVDAPGTFAIDWVAQSPGSIAASPRNWCVVSLEPGAASALAAALEAQQQRVQILTPDQFRPAPGQNVITLCDCTRVIALARQWVAVEGAGALWIVTRHAVATGRETFPLNLADSPLAGFARAFALEQPTRWGGLIDVESFAPGALAEAVTTLLAAPADDVVAWRSGVAWAPRLRPRPAAGVSPAPVVSSTSTYLITGGTGGIGLALARWLVAAGARHLALLSRTAPRSAAREVIAELTAAGADVRVIAGDVSVREDVARAFAGIDGGAAPLGGVFHAAGVSGFAPFTTLAPEAFAAVLEPKVAGTRHLDELTRDRALDHFVLFSSIASVWGSQGQTHYAAANAFLDATAHERRRLGLPGLSVNWGPWADAGMAAGPEREKLRRLGLEPLKPASALAQLGRLLGSDETQLAVADVNWAVLQPLLALRRPQPLLEAFAPAPTKPPPGAESEILRRLRAADPTRREALLGDYLQAQIGRVLGRDAGARIEPQQGFFALGMDSLMAVELRAQLERDLALSLPATLAFDCATLQDLQADLARRLFPAATASEPLAPSRPLAPDRHAAEPIAIIGLACRFPGGASTPTKFWELLRSGRNAAGPVPSNRWSIDEHYHPDPDHAGTMYVRTFGFIEDVDQFDHTFFNLYPREARAMDPQQRLLLETAWQALETAGLANAALRGSATGTFVGASTSDYAQRVLQGGDRTQIDAYFGTGNALNAIAGRVAYTFGLRGPTLVTDTACSSSLVALHQACLSLRAGECAQAIAAGVNLMLTPEPAIALSRARMLAPDGRCKTFAADADGYGRGEGCGVVVLKRLSDARAAHDPILAVITGSAVNQDGASSGFTVPSRSAQEELIRQALAQAGRSPDDLDYIEAHGTGTPLGDPIEINALGDVVGPRRSRPLYVGSVKTNLGHLESAAGIAGVIKTVLALRHETIPAHVNLTEPSPHIRWAELPVTVPRTALPWPAHGSRPRVAGVSAFGFTGTNAHVVLESAAVDNAAPTPSRPLYLVPLAAKNAEALAALRARVLEWLRDEPDFALPDIARTFGAGRQHFAFRECHVVSSTTELRNRLLARLESPSSSPPAPPAPLAFVCDAAGVESVGARLQRLGLAPALVIAEAGGLPAAGALAGLWDETVAQQLTTRRAVLETIHLPAPRVGLAHRSVGRISDALAASREWWRAALAGAPLPPAEEIPALREVRLAPLLAEDAFVHLVATLYAEGRDLDWTPLTAPGEGRHRPDAPTYPFQRRRHWIDIATPAPRPARRADPATLLGERLPLPGSREIRFAAEYSADAGFLQHHRLFGRMIASAAQHIALLITATRASLRTESCTATALTFPKAMTLGEEERRHVQLVIKPSASGPMPAEVISASSPEDEAWVTHAVATVETGATTADDWGRTPSLPGPGAGKSETYAQLAARGYTLGPSFCWLDAVRTAAGSATARLVPAEGALAAFDYDLHPGLLDSCFQLIGIAAGVEDEELADGKAIYIPARIDAVRYHRRPSRNPLTCEVRITEPATGGAHRLRGDFRLQEDDGSLVLEVLGFEARRAPRAGLFGGTPDVAGPFYRLSWPEITIAPAPEAAPQHWALLGRGATRDDLAQRLTARGHAVSGSDTVADNAAHVVLFTEPTPGAGANVAPTLDLLALVQALVQRTAKPRLAVVTRGAQSVDDDRYSPVVAGAAVVGLARVAATEHPELHLQLIDLEPGAAVGEAALLEQALLAAANEPQLALRGGRCRAARLVPTVPAAAATATVRLGLQQYGNLDSLALQPLVRTAPGPQAVEIEVQAAGLNFRDVIGALGLLREHLRPLGIETEADLPFGGECAGVVTRVGATVTSFRPGDSVIAVLATGCMASHVNVDARFVAPRPPRLAPAEAASLPVAYLTAWYGLRTLAHVRPGERVLIHAAAGGVGLAAIHVARLLGAEVLATASPAKWPTLRALGVKRIGHSRQLEYGRDFGRVDVVLNSLVGEHIPTSLDLLAPGGRFVEIGKLGIWTAEQVAARRSDISYHPFDIIELSRATPECIGTVLRELAPHWASAALPALPLQVFPLTRAADAFRWMSTGKHIGKLVLTRTSAPPARPSRQGVYLITGGLGGLGLAVADWLATQGAGTVILASRRGPDALQQAQLAAWGARGCTVVWEPADLSVPGAARELVTRCVAEHGALRGLFHAAGVLDDSVLAQLTADRLQRVYGPKATAAWELHEATLEQPLDFFVLFSSLAAVLGSPGQAAYASANAALDALAHHRRRLGRPALSINWGPWAAAGMTARLSERELARLRQLGLTPFAPADGIRALADALGSVDAQVTAVQLDAARLLHSHGTRVPPLLAQLRPGPTAAPTHSAAARLGAVPTGDRPKLVVDALAARLGTTLGLAAGETLPRDRDLTSLGFDSLTAVELHGWIAGEFGVEVPMQQIAGLSLDGLAAAILALLQLDGGARAATEAAPIEQTLAADARLPADFRLAGSPAPLAPPRVALLTGATGFLGAFLLDELLRTTSATVHCLVRADSPASGRERILANLATYGLGVGAAADRIVVVPGDLTLPGLGLTAPAFEALSGTVDTIYHNGAWLNFFYAYDALRAANVEGTRDILRLATRGTPKPIHYVSTSGVFYSREYRGRVLPETDAAEHCVGHALGYSQSKWVAERLMTAAAERGLPVTIHRAPFITGDRGTGAWNRDDFICRLVRGIIALGAMPDLSASMDIVPVDYVARSIVQLSQRPESVGRRFHLCAVDAVPWSALADWLGELGHPVVRDPYAQWIARLPALRGTDHPLAPFVPLFLEKAGPDRPTVPEVFLQSAHSRLDGSATAALVESLGIPPPVIDVPLWRRYLDKLRADGMLPESSTQRPA